MKTVRLGKSAKLAAAMSLVLSVGSLQTASAAYINSSSGVICTPTSLSQAIGSIAGGNIAWNHMRVHNRSSLPLWVVCSTRNEMGTDGTNLYVLDGGQVHVTAWFGPTAAPTAQVFCITREVQGGTTVTTGDAASVSISAGDPLPDTEVGLISTAGFAVAQPVTTTCKLDPGTGIQGIAEQLAVD